MLTLIFTMSSQRVGLGKVVNSLHLTNKPQLVFQLLEPDDKFPTTQAYSFKISSSVHLRNAQMYKCAVSALDIP